MRLMFIIGASYRVDSQRTLSLSSFGAFESCYAITQDHIDGIVACQYGPNLKF